MARVEFAAKHRLGSLSLDAAFTTNAPWTVLFGPSGSGKSTVLRALAGLFRPDWAKMAALGEVICDSGVTIAPHRRPSRWAGQGSALFPNRTVRGNLQLGFEGEVDEVIRHFGLLALADRWPAELSGGQQQRVAVARAAAGARGKLLLLDEPFTGLDAGMREELIEQVRAWVGQSPVISVTHDVGEAYLLDAEVVRMAEGRVVAQGPVRDVLGGERARLAGVLG